MPIVFVHGFLGSSKDFLFVQKELSDFHIVEYNLPVHASPQTLPQYSLKNLALHLLSFLEANQIPKAHFWGYSLGGRVLLELLKTNPEKFDTLTLESVSPGLTDTTEKKLRLKKDQEWATVLNDDPQIFLAKWYAQDLFNSFRKHPHFVQSLTMRSCVINAEHAKVIVEASPGANPDNFNTLKTALVPVLVLVGEKDPKYQEIWNSPKLEKPINIDIRTIPQSGHVIHIENPSFAAHVFKEFQRSFE